MKIFNATPLENDTLRKNIDIEVDDEIIAPSKKLEWIYSYKNISRRLLIVKIRNTAREAKEKGCDLALVFGDDTNLLEIFIEEFRKNNVGVFKTKNPLKENAKN